MNTVIKKITGNKEGAAGTLSPGPHLSGGCVSVPRPRHQAPPRPSRGQPRGHVGLDVRQHPGLVQEHLRVRVRVCVCVCVCVSECVCV